MPYLGYVADLVTLELHDIDVVGAVWCPFRGTPDGLGVGMLSMEHAVRGNVVSLRIP